MNSDDKIFLEAINDISATVGTSTAETMEALDLKSLCLKYKAIKGKVELILPFIEKIPGFGTTVAGALRLLMRVADRGCAIA